MTTTYNMTAMPREKSGKGASRAIRRQGRVPAVIYGNGQTPVNVSLDPLELNKALHRTGFFASLVDLKLDKGSHLVLPRDVQFHPVTDMPIHVDLMRVGADTVLTVAVPVQFLNDTTCPGVKRGGVLNIVRHEIEVTCRADNIPNKLVADLADMDIGDNLHISAIALPERCETDHCTGFYRGYHCGADDCDRG
ncbi:MAG: 50S ribosomal protein L25/general stress protein Ctc [Alphaproteobacteria bacterium]